MPNEWRCKKCGVLLAKRDEIGLTIRRGGLQATMDGRFRVALVCYRPHCRTQNIIYILLERSDPKSPTAP